MTQTVEKFLEAEQSAQQLLNTLEVLKEEAVSYKTSKKELDAARLHLVSLIEAIQVVAKDTKEVVQILLKIGSPEILRLIDSISKQLQTESDSSRAMVRQLRTFVLIGLSASLLSFVGIILLLVR